MKEMRIQSEAETATVKASDSGQEMAVRFLDIGGIVDHHCERGSFVLLTIIVTGDRSFYWWNC